MEVNHLVGMITDFGKDGKPIMKVRVHVKFTPEDMARGKDAHTAITKPVGITELNNDEKNAMLGAYGVLELAHSFTMISTLKAVENMRMYQFMAHDDMDDEEIETFFNFTPHEKLEEYRIMTI